MRKSYVFLFALTFSLFSFTFNLQYANAANYFEQVLSGITHSSIGNSFGGVLSPINNLANFGKNIFATQSADPNILNINTNTQTNTNIPKSSEVKTQTNINANNNNPFLDNSSQNQNNSNSNNQPQSYLSAILQKIGLANPNTQNPTQNPLQNTNPTLVQPTIASPYQTPQTPFYNPATGQYQSQPAAQNNSLPQMLGTGGLSGLGGVPQKYSPSPSLQPGPVAPPSAAPYNGPGGDMTTDCPGFEKGPVAYNIGGTSGDGVSCSAKNVVVGYDQDFKKGVFNLAYVNPMLESGMSQSGASTGNCAGGTAKSYDEKCFSDYSKGAGFAYIEKQLLEIQKRGKSVGQKCVPIDLDNCDSIGTKNYQAILDAVKNLNNSGDVKIKVLNKNPQSSACNFMGHSEVIGALVEVDKNDSAQLLKQIAGLRKNNSQIILMARGGDGAQNNLTAAEQEADKSKITNVAFSHDTGGVGDHNTEYKNVNACSYK